MARTVTGLLAVGALVLAVLALPPPAYAGKPWIGVRASSNPVTPRTTFWIRGRIGNVGPYPNKKVVLRHKGPDGWHRYAVRKGLRRGSYAFRVTAPSRPGTQRFRTLVRRKGRILARSRLLDITVARAAAPARALYPDVAVQNLTECSSWERERSDNATCFSVRVRNGITGLWFPAVTGNAGDGRLEIRASRSSSSTLDWKARQLVDLEGGGTTSFPLDNTFYWAQDGHDHWHIRDFDRYEILDASGTLLRRGEKHGFCFFDNAHWKNWVPGPGNGGHEGVPSSPVYAEQSSCGEAQHEATSIVHGLSRGWADLYPTSLGDQYIDITGFGDGVYVVRVTADWQGFIHETVENNNSASARVTIAGGKVIEAVRLTGGG